MLESKITSPEVVRSVEIALAKYRNIPAGLHLSIAKNSRQEMIREATEHSLQMEDRDARQHVEQPTKSHTAARYYRTLVSQMTNATVRFREKLLQESVVTVDDLVEIHGNMFMPEDRMKFGGLRHSNVYVSGPGGWFPPEHPAIDQHLSVLLGVVNESLKRNAILDAASTLHLGVTYCQPFIDGNKRTARTACNAILLAYDLPPPVITVGEREVYLGKYVQPAVQHIRESFSSSEDLMQALPSCRPFFDYIGEKIVANLSRILHGKKPSDFISRAESTVTTAAESKHHSYEISLTQIPDESSLTRLKRRLIQQASLNNMQLSLSVRKITPTDAILIADGTAPYEMLAAVIQKCARHSEMRYVKRSKQ